MGNGVLCPASTLTLQKDVDQLEEDWIESAKIFINLKKKKKKVMWGGDLELRLWKKQRKIK